MSVESAPEGEADSSTDASDKEFVCPGCEKVYSSQEGRRHHMVGCCPAELHPCPSCDKLLINKLGVKRHHTRSHGESISKVDVGCEYCGGTNMVYEHRVSEHENHFCSRDCNSKWLSKHKSGTDHYSYNSVSFECDNCGEEFTRQPSKLKRCENNFCGFECYGEYRSREYTREDNPRWTGGGVDDYGERWPRQRRKALGRDDHECQICGASKETIGRNPDVHHVTPVRVFEDPNDAHDLENLLTLCRKHHKLAKKMAPLRPV